MSLMRRKDREITDHTVIGQMIENCDVCRICMNDTPVPYAVPLSDQLAENFDAVIHKSNGFLMENHGAVMVSPEGLKRCLEMMEMMEAQGKSMIVAKLMGNLKSLGKDSINELDAGVIKVRNLPMPGLPGEVKQLSDIFVCD